MRDEVLNHITDGRLKVYVVWEPILPKDRVEEVPEAAKILAGEWRATQFWDASAASGKAYLKTLAVDLKKPAWDVYLVFPPGVKWQSEAPLPAFWMHQLTFVPFSQDARKFEPLRLDTSRMRAWIEKQLASPGRP